MHLDEVFSSALNFGISLNPRKYAFSITENELLGQLARKEGVTIDPKRIESIDKIQRPKNVKGVQSFFG